LLPSWCEASVSATSSPSAARRVCRCRAVMRPCKNTRPRVRPVPFGNRRPHRHGASTRINVREKGFYRGLYRRTCMMLESTNLFFFSISAKLSKRPSYIGLLWQIFHLTDHHIL
jgi:hypothetical protein